MLLPVSILETNKDTPTMGDEYVGPNGYQAKLQRKQKMAPVEASMWLIPHSSKPLASSYYAEVPSKPTRMALKLVHQYICFFKSNTIRPLDFRINLDKFIKAVSPSKNRTVPREAIPQGAVDIVCCDHSVTLAPDQADPKRGAILMQILKGWKPMVQEGEFDVWKKRQGDWLRHTVLLNARELIITRKGILDDRKLKCNLADIVAVRTPSERLARVKNADAEGAVDIRISQKNSSGGRSTSTLTLRGRGAIDRTGAARIGAVEEQMVEVLLHMDEEHKATRGFTASNRDTWEKVDIILQPHPTHGMGVVIVKEGEGDNEHLKVQQLRRNPDGGPSRAETAGLRVNDVVTAINHQPVTSVPELLDAKDIRPSDLPGRS